MLHFPAFLGLDGRTARRETDKRVRRILKGNATALDLFDERVEQQTFIEPGDGRPIFLRSMRGGTAMRCIRAFLIHHRLVDLAKDVVTSNRLAAPLCEHPCGVLSILDRNYIYALADDHAVVQRMLRTIADTWDAYHAFGPVFYDGANQLRALYDVTVLSYLLAVAGLKTLAEAPLEWNKWQSAESMKWTIERTLAGDPPTLIQLQDFHGGRVPSRRGRLGAAVA